MYAGNDYKRRIIPFFKEAFEKQVQETIHPDMLIPEIEIDAEIDFADITLNSPDTKTV
jgi:single-stranded-DNA-specific exonuclease